MAKLIDKKEAILEGAKAAGILHTRLGIQNQITQKLSSVDVYDSISKLDIALLFKDMNGPLGLCIPGENPGILINRGRPHMMQRFTAAHELGHIFMNHGGSIDNRVFEIVDDSDNSVPLEEVAADAFASEFLLPRWLMALHARKQGWTKKETMTNPSIVYQLSLRVGASFEATGWGLRTHNILTYQEFNSVKATTPKEHKLSLIGKLPLQNPLNDVWHLSPKDDGISYSVRQGDYIVIELPSIASTGYLWEFSEVMNGFTVVEDQLIESIGVNHIGGPAHRRVVLLMRDSGEFSIRLDEKRPWKKEGAVRASFQSDLTVLKAETGGLPNSAKVRRVA